jgi:transposase-like protein
MATQSAIPDEVLTGALGLYAGMVDKVVNDPERWLGLDDDQDSTGGVPSRVLDAVRDRALGTVTPASDAWEQLPRERRVDWWVARVGLSAGLAAAAPRVAGALADRVPLQAALGASAAGLAVCAVAREHGVTDPRDWVPLLAQVLLDRDLAVVPETAVPSAAEAEQALTADDDDEEPSRLRTLGQGAQSAVRTLWRLARAFRELQHLLDERPRGSFLARAVGKLPVVGVAGGWLDERGGIRKAATKTEVLLG